MDHKQGKKSLIFIGLIALIIVGIVVFMATQLHTDPIADSLDKDQVIKVLFVVNDGNGHALSTDVLVYYQNTQKGSLFEISGNTGAIYDSLSRVDRVDEVYAEKGINVYCQEIENLTGVQIPFTIDINIDNLGLLADLLGGLKVKVPSPVEAYGENGELWLLPGGDVSLDGDKIKTYMYYILPDENEKHLAERRQNVVVSLLSSIGENKSTILNKKNINAFTSKIESNAGKNGTARLLEEIANLDSERMVPLVMLGSNRMVDGKKLLFPQDGGQLLKDSIKRAIGSLVSNDADRFYVINIQNGTSIQGLARNTSILLQSIGYDVLGSSNAESNDIEDTVIINHIGNTKAAQALGNFIHCTNIVDEEVKPEEAGLNSAAAVDFTIILGRDFDGRYVRATRKAESPKAVEEDKKEVEKSEAAEVQEDKKAAEKNKKQKSKDKKNKKDKKEDKSDEKTSEQNAAVPLPEISNKVQDLENALNKLKEEKTQSESAGTTAPAEQTETKTESNKEKTSAGPQVMAESENQLE